MAENPGDPQPAEVIQRSTKLLQLAKEQVRRGGSYLNDLQTSRPESQIAVPYLQTPEDAQAPPSPTKPTGADADIQERLKAIIANKFKSDLNLSTLQIQAPTTPTEHNEEPIQIQEETKIEAKPLIKEVVVISDEIAPTDQKFLALATETYPLQQDNAQFVPRNISEEGFWIPDLPLCKPSNLFRLENRLLWADQDRQQFFSADGHLRADTPYVQQIPPPFPIDPPSHDGAGLLMFHAAQNEEVVEGDVARKLILEIRSVRFLIHSLSSPEDIASYRLNMAYKAYQENLSANKKQLFQKRQQALSKQLDEEMSKAPADEKQAEILKERKIALIQKLLECYDDYDREGSLQGSLRDELIRISHELKDSRVNYTSTATHLRWQKATPTEEETEKEKKILNEFIEMRARLTIQLEELLGHQTLDIKQVQDEIRQRRKDLCLRNPGDPKWIAVFANDAAITPNEQVPVEEQQRRAAIQSTQTSVKIIIPNQSQFSTMYSRINNNFESIINKQFELQTTRLPSSVIFEVWEMDTKRKERAVARVSIPVYVGTPPEFFSYEFSSDFQLPNGNLITGTVDARIYIKADENEKILVSIPDANTKTKKRLQGDPSQFISQPRYEEDAKAFDPNDPYIVANLATMASHHAKERVNNNFRLDVASNAVSLSNFVPASVNFQAKLRIQQMLDEKKRKELLEKKKAEHPDDYTEHVKIKDDVQQAVVKPQIQYTDIVKEAPMPTLPSLLAAIVARFFMFRPLKPVRKERVPSSSIQQYSKIIIHIIRSSTVPQRDGMGTGPGTESSLVYSSATERTSACFARVTYDGVSRETDVINNNAPEWNQRFTFDVAKNVNETPTIGDLQQKDVRIDLFDKVAFQIIEDDREQQTTHQAFENRNLASISFPVDAIWASGKVDGIITLNTPPAYFGYNNEAGPVTMKVFFTIDPPMKFAPIVTGKDSAEEPRVTEPAQRWMNAMLANELTRGRFINLLTHPKNYKPFLICRMVKPQRPPPTLEGKPPEVLARFVSLIPNLSDNRVYGIIGDLWNTSQQFLNLNAGDEEEHAALLCNFFKSRTDMANAYLVFGYTIDNGRTIYVLTKAGSTSTLWDPNTGRKFLTTSSDCPMYSVGCVCDEKNVWANIQASSEPWKLRWNFAAAADWKPFMTGELPPFVTPQEDSLTFTPEIGQDELRSIAENIEQDVMLCVQRLRESHQTTQWNSAPQEYMYSIMDLSEQLMQGGEEERMRHIKEQMKTTLMRMKDSIRNTRFFGAPFCLPFTDKNCIGKEVTDEIKAREIYLTEMKGVYFCIKVKLYPYPNGRAAVWVFLAMMQNISPGAKRLN